MTTNAVMVIRLLIASNHPVVREGLLALLDAVDGVEPVGTAPSDEEVLVQMRALRPDVLLLDVQLDMQLSEEDGTTLTGRIKTQYPDVRILILSPTFRGPEVWQALADGAEGVVAKTAEAPQLIQAIVDVASGRSSTDGLDQRPLSDELLSNRETDVLECVARGMSNAEIAFALSISVFTVKAHVEHILRKLKASDRASAVAKAFRRGLIQ